MSAPRKSAIAQDPHDEPAAVTKAAHVEPDTELDPDEPQTPSWMPLLGGVLFLVGGLLFVGFGTDGKTTEQLQEEATKAAEAAAAAAAPPPPPTPPPAAQAPKRQVNPRNPLGG